ncbi:hypothetical protein BDZ88DRAFT_406814 [Geranomyces variabilis]|nr:hypothetical protein BDZ88DRAFT_406814 [Geranomyces variabilis]KAJ3139315.1 hypothetical protein HDU90_000681 [Geranomyces variabilis]
MRATLSLATVALLAASAHAITILDAIRANPQLSLVAAGIAQHPEWAVGTAKTLVAPTDAAIQADRASGHLAANQLGVFFLPTVAQTWKDVLNYKVLHGADTSILFDNYVPMGPPEVHVRSSTAEGILTGYQQCDDGWLYTSPIAFEPSVVPSVAMVATPKANAFLALFQKIGAVNALNSLSGVTIFCPTDAAVAASAAQLNALAPNQLAYVLSAHIAVGAKYTTELDNGAWTSINAVPLTLAIVGEASTVNGVPFGTLVDVPTAAGALHTLSRVIIPANIPAADAAAPVMLGQVNVATAPGPSSAAVPAASSVPAAVSSAAPAVGTSSASASIVYVTSTQEPVPASTEAATPKPSTTASAAAVNSGSEKLVGAVGGAIIAGVAGLAAAL